MYMIQNLGFGVSGRVGECLLEGHIGLDLDGSLLLKLLQHLLLVVLHGSLLLKVIDPAGNAVGLVLLLLAGALGGSLITVLDGVHNVVLVETGKELVSRVPADLPGLLLGEVLVASGGANRSGLFGLGKDSHCDVCVFECVFECVCESTAKTQDVCMEAYFRFSHVTACVGRTEQWVGNEGA